MLVYSPTQIQSNIAMLLKDEEGIARLVTNQQIYDAVADVISDPRPIFPNEVLWWTRVKLTNDFIEASHSMKVAEGVL